MVEQDENLKNNEVGVGHVSTDDHAGTHAFHPSKSSSFFAFSEKLSSSEILRWVIIVLLPVLIFLRYTVESIDYDMWWQMAHGKYYVTHHTLKMDLSVFSWTPTDPTWIYNTCLGSIAIYLFYNFMGGFGLWAFQWLVFGGVFLSFYLFLRLLNQRLDISGITLIAAIGIACSMACRFYKPELFSLLIFNWTVCIYFYAKITHKKFLFYLYPLIFLFWVNLHGAFAVGLVFLAMAFTGEILNRILFPGKSLTTEDLMHFGIACILSGIATLINPYGIDYLLNIYKGVVEANTPLAQLHNRAVMAYMSLWPYLKATDISFFGGGLTAWIMTLMMSSVLCLSLYEFIKHKSCDFALLIFSVVFYWKGMETNRASYFFPVAFFFIFFYLLIHRLKFRSIPGKITIFALAIFVFFCSSMVYVHMIRLTDNKWFGIGLEDLAPVKETEFLKKYRLEGPIFNDYAIGGYLVWDLYPAYKVFIDPRGGLYMNQVFADYLDFTSKRVNGEDIRRFREKYPFNIVVLHYRQKNLIIDFLTAGEDEWRLVYFDRNAAVLIHKTLLPVVLSQMKHVDLSPVRFRDVKDPQILLNVFDFYVRTNPNAGRYIYNVFKKNVRDVDNQKQDYLNKMDTEIRHREAEFKRKAPLASS